LTEPRVCFASLASIREKPEVAVQGWWVATQLLRAQLEIRGHQFKAARAAASAAEGAIVGPGFNSLDSDAQRQSHVAQVCTVLELSLNETI
jgi:hypothetical protein